MVKFDHQERPSQFDFRGFKVIDQGFEDDGYLLISRYSKSFSQTVVELIEIRTQNTVHRWVPDLDAIFSMTPRNAGGINTRMAYRSQHPMLLPNGDLIIGSGEGPLVRIDPCGKPRWAIDRHFHHSIEMDSEGTIIAPIVTGEGIDKSGIEVRDEGVALVSQDGRLLAEYSLSQLLLDNGFRGLIYGVGIFEKDRYHLNDAQPLVSKTAAAGILLSVRNLSSTALFRPGTGKIEWFHTGPWLNQHDIEDLGNGYYSLFGNDLVRGPEKIIGKGHSEIYIFDPTTGDIQTPYSSVLEKTKMHSGYEGRVKILGNGDAFIEETNRDRILRVSPNGVRWEYVNGITENTTGALHWSRYLNRNEINRDWLEKLPCDR